MDTIILFDYKCSVDNSNARRKFFGRRRKGKGQANCSYILTRQRMADYQLIRVDIYELIRACSSPICLKMYERRRRREQAVLAEQLKEELAPLLDKWGENACIYDSLISPELWVYRLLPLPEFEAYLEEKWVRRLLLYAKWDHFLVLGTAPCLHRILCELAPRMKSLMWVLPDYTYQEQAENFAEDFYQEYGLAINLHFLPEGSTFGHLRISAEHLREPVNILDLTGEKYVPYCHPAEGSVWLDASAMPDKEKRIQSHGLKVCYYSLTLRAKTDIIL